MSMISQNNTPQKYGDQYNDYPSPRQQNYNPVRQNGNQNNSIGYSNMFNSPLNQDAVDFEDRNFQNNNGGNWGNNQGQGQNNVGSYGRRGSSFMY